MQKNHTLDDCPWAFRYNNNNNHNYNNYKRKFEPNTLQKCNIKTHGVDPGWFSLDEYSAEYRIKRSLFFPPIDEIDAASRVLYPLFANKPSFSGTWRNYIPLVDF